MGCTFIREKDNNSRKIYQHLSDYRFIVRDLELEDYSRGFIETLNVYYDVYADENITEEKFTEIFRQISHSSYLHKVVIIEDRAAVSRRERIIGTGTVLVKPNIFGVSGPNAYFEDIALRDVTDAITARRIINCLAMLSTDAGCEKICTKATEVNKPFYEDYGFVENGASMEYLISSSDQRRQELKNEPEKRRSYVHHQQKKSPDPQHKIPENGKMMNNYFVQSSEPPQ